VKRTPLLILALTLIIVAVSAVGFDYWRIASKVRIEYPPPPPTIKIGIYTNSSCVESVSEIDWGTLYPGGMKTCYGYVRNEGDVPVLLTLSTETWNPPEAEQYMALNWNYSGAQIPVTTGINVEFQLTVFSNCSGITSFSFDIVITAEG